MAHAKAHVQRRRLRRGKALRYKRWIGHRHTQTDTDILAERHARIKIVIASRKETNVISSVCFCVSLWQR